MLPGLRACSMRAISACFAASCSMITSMIQSASPTSAKSSAKLPSVIRSATAALKSDAGRAFAIRSNPARTIRLRTARLSSVSPFFSSSGVSVSGAISSSVTRSPAFAQCPAIAAPIVPAPSTATRRIVSLMHPPKTG